MLLNQRRWKRDIDDLKNYKYICLFTLSKLGAGQNYWHLSLVKSEICVVYDIMEAGGTIEVWAFYSFAILLNKKKAYKFFLYAF